MIYMCEADVGDRRCGRAEMGKAVGKSGDGGIDGIIKEDALGLDVVYMQAKRYAADNSIGRQDVHATPTVTSGKLEDLPMTRDAMPPVEFNRRVP